jgi:hypothetical protein
MADHALYLEVDEDITSAIDKLRKAPGTSVQIVVPKRSGILQSIINLKLLKKAATDAGKELVLVTNDKVAGDLAGRIGIPVAASLGGRPVINEPARPMPKNDIDEIIEADDPVPAGDLMDIEDGAAKPVAILKRPAFSRRDIDKPKPIPLAAVAVAAASEEASAAEAGEIVSTPSHHTATGASKVPSFTKLQRRLGWAGLAIALIIGYMVTMYYLTSANVKLYAIGTKVSVDGSFVADTAAGQSDSSKGVLAAQEVTFTKDATTPVTPTGQKDNGTKANGTITVSNKTLSDRTFVAGTRFAAPDGKIFKSNEDVNVPHAYLAPDFTAVAGTANIAVTADQNGDSYNEAAAAYTIVALGSQSQFTAKGGQMSNGTSKIATVLTQADIDKAQAALLASDKDASTAALNTKVPSDSQALPDSVAQVASALVPNPAVGQEATAANLSLKITYTVLAVKKSDYKAMLVGLETKQIGAKNQIYDDGASAAKVTSNGKDGAGRPNFNISALAYGGAKLDTAAIGKQLKGMKYGEASALAGGLPGVDHAEINVWPAWFTSLPKRPTRIHVTVSVANSKG